MTRIALLSTSDTDLLQARASNAAYLWANPTRVSDADLAALLADADLVVFRFLGSVQSLPSTFEAVRRCGRPFVVLGGEQAPDASLMELSTVPLGVASEAHTYLAQGGAANLRHLHGFLADTVLLSGDIFEPPVAQPNWGLLSCPTPRPTGSPAAQGRHHLLPRAAGGSEHGLRRGPC